MRSNATVLFRVGANSEIGLGHLRRSLSLATALREEGVESRFLAHGSGEALEYAGRFPFPTDTLSTSELWSRADARATAVTSGQARAQAVVVDAPDVPGEYLGWLREEGLFVIVRDDLARHPFSCQIVVNGNADAEQLPYVSSSGETLFLLGTKYAVLPRDFWRPRPRRVRETVRHVLLTLGGADSHDLMPKLLQVVDELPGDFTATAVVGPLFRNGRDVRVAAARARRPVRVIEGPDSLHALMLEADIAVSAAGQTLYELACLGCPTVAIKTGGDQAGQLQAFAAAGCVRSAGDAAARDLIPSVAESLLFLLRDSSSRAASALAGQRLVDGRGAFRVASAISKRALLSDIGISSLR